MGGVPSFVEEREVIFALAGRGRGSAGLPLIPNCGDIDSSVPPSRPSTAPISHWTTVRFCNECPGWGARSMSQGLRVLVLDYDAAFEAWAEGYTAAEFAAEVAAGARA